MMEGKEAEFFQMVETAIKENPRWVETAVRAVQSGIVSRIKLEQNDRIEWETVAMNAMEARMFKHNKGWLAQKIEKLEGRSFFRWEHIIERLKE